MNLTPVRLTNWTSEIRTIWQPNQIKKRWNLNVRISDVNCICERTRERQFPPLYFWCLFQYYFGCLSRNLKGIFVDFLAFHCSKWNRNQILIKNLIWFCHLNPDRCDKINLKNDVKCWNWPFLINCFTRKQMKLIENRSI